MTNRVIPCENVKGRSQTIFMGNQVKDNEKSCKPTIRKNKKIFDSIDNNTTKIISIDIDIMKDTVHTNEPQKSKRSRVAIFSEVELYQPRFD